MVEVQTHKVLFFDLVLGHARWMFSFIQLRKAKKTSFQRIRKSKKWRKEMKRDSFRL